MQGFARALADGDTGAYSRQTEHLTLSKMDDLLYFAAIQNIRVPSFRPVLLRIADAINRSIITGALKS
jgi:hypothetical protein